MDDRGNFYELKKGESLQPGTVLVPAHLSQVVQELLKEKGKLHVDELPDGKLKKWAISNLRIPKSKIPSGK